jgi:hypothetical protein
MLCMQTYYRKLSVLKQMSELLLVLYWISLFNRILTYVVIVFCHVEWIIH